jgi:hypothetical protein
MAVPKYDQQNPFPYLYNGKRCRISEAYRALHGIGPGRERFGNRYIVRFEDGTVENIPAGKFNKDASYPKILD